MIKNFLNKEKRRKKRLHKFFSKEKNRVRMRAAAEEFNKWFDLKESEKK